jgi:hypothetical protein
MPDQQAAKGPLEVTSDRAWNLAKLVVIVLVVIFFILELGRESLDDGIRLRPVIMKVAVADDVPTSEMATQRILAYLNDMQSTGEKEWRQLRIIDGASEAQSPSEISIQIPGTSVSLESVVREVASFLPNRHRTLIVSIAPSPNSTEYVASITTISWRETSHATCRSGPMPAFNDGRAKVLDAMFECLAREAIKSIDILYAAAYALSSETENCKVFNAKPAATDAGAIDDYVEALRKSCGFDRTRLLVSKIVERGTDYDARWIPFFIGKLRRARAEALKSMDPEAQFFELDRAISRYGELPDGDSGPALAIAMEAAIDKAVSLHEAAGNNWTTDEAKRQLAAAEAILKDADRRLAAGGIGSSPFCFVRDGLTPEIRNKQKLPDEVTLRPMLQGMIKYRLWMISRDRYTHQITSGSQQEERALEDSQLREAIDKFALAYCSGRRSNELFMTWGDALLVLHEFDPAVEKFRQAADLSPDDDRPFLNIALALLRKVSNNGPEVDAKAQLAAMRAVSDHLSWASTGGAGTPYAPLTAEVRKALEWPKDSRELQPFDECMDSHMPQPSKEREAKDTQHHLQRAQLKICVDATRDRMAARVDGAYTLDR